MLCLNINAFVRPIFSVFKKVNLGKLFYEVGVFMRTMTLTTKNGNLALSETPKTGFLATRPKFGNLLLVLTYFALLFCVSVETIVRSSSLARCSNSDILLLWSSVRLSYSTSVLQPSEK